ncbi:MAG TPA: WbqC family protein [Pyrinomonadaceae bacterium]|nr:WbqC family protein [Pyrinomonadaceae bacterium]
MKVAIHQPQYFPWAPYVHKVMSADIFVYLDIVQFSKNGVQNRNQIKTAQGPLWLTVPVKHQLEQKIAQTAVADPRFARKHWKTIQYSYSKCLGFERWQEELKALFESDFELLVDAAIDSTEWMLGKLQVNNQRLKASDLGEVKGEASQLVASICKELKATTYLTGTGALAYLDPADFASINCEIQIQRWTPFSYQQTNVERGFVPDLSALDLLLNCPDTARDLIAGAGSWLPLEAT